MHHASTLTGLALLGLSRAIPVTLPASATTQNQIIGAENTITQLAADYVQANAANAKNDYNSIVSQFASIAPQALTPSNYVCLPPFSLGNITTEDEALTSLNSTQNFLMQLSLDLQNAASVDGDINTAFCNANTSLTAVYQYTFDIVGTPANGASNDPVATGYDASKLNSTAQATDIALQAIINGLYLVVPGQPANSYTKTAYTNAESALATFAEVAGVPSRYGCPAFTLAPATDAQSAIEDVQLVQRTVTQAVVDTTASGPNLNDFCKITEYMNAVDAYVQA